MTRNYLSSGNRLLCHGAGQGTSLPLTQRLAGAVSEVFSPASRHREAAGRGCQGAGAPVAGDDIGGPSPPGQRVVFEYLLDMLVSGLIRLH